MLKGALIDWPEKVAFAATLVVLGLGIMVMAGWHLHQPVLIQIYSGFPPMQYNTALCFSLSGLSLFFIILRLYPAAAFFSSLVLIIGIITLFEFLTGADLYLDRLFMEPYLPSDTLAPGRMAASSAMSFILSGIGLVICSGPRRFPYRPGVLSIIASFLIAFSIVSIIGLLAEVETAFAWQFSKNMAIHSAFGFLVLGLGIISLSLSSIQEQSGNSSPYVPIMAGMIGVAASVLLWQALLSYNRNHIRGMVEIHAKSIGETIISSLQNRVLSLDRMAKRWEFFRHMSIAEEKFDGGLLMSSFYDYKAVARLAPDLSLSWGLSRGAAELQEYYNFFSERTIQKAMRAAGKKTGTTDTVTLPGGIKGFLIFVPLFSKGFSGWILGTIDLPVFFGDILKESSSWGYSVAVYENREEIFGSYSTKKYLTEWGAGKDLTLYGVTWRLYIWPKHFLLKDLQSHLPTIILLGGCLVSFLSAFSLYLAQISRAREKDTHDANAQLQTEIVQRRRAEEEARAALTYSRTLIEASLDPMIAVSLKGKIIDVNRSAERITGLPRSDLTGRNLYDFFTEPEKAREICSKIASGLVVRDYPLTVRHSSGSTTDVLCNANLYHDETGRPQGVLSTIRDITERKKWEEELLKAQKLESVGLLAGGIAHEFNNLLTGILGYISLMRLNANLDRNTRQMLEQAEAVSLQAKDLTVQLLTFSRGGAPVKKKIYLNDVLRQSAEFGLRGSNVNLQTKIPGDLWPVEADAAQIGQVVNNLVVNAREAMQRGGTVLLWANNIVWGEGVPSSKRPGKYIEFSVQDHGQGIPAENLAKIYDPYFTTKEEGRGLGLAVAFSIIEKHGGYIDVESQIGQGTTFHVYLPAVEVSETEITEKIKAAPKEELKRGKQGKILLMDGEETVRKIASEMMEYLGYEVVQVKDGRQAVGLYKAAFESGRPFDLTILDLTVAGALGGVETLNELKKFHPEVKAVISSGYAGDPVMINPGQFGFKCAITKPYQIEEMANIIRRAMENGC